MLFQTRLFSQGMEGGRSCRWSYARNQGAKSRATSAFPFIRLLEGEMKVRELIFGVCFRRQ